MTRNPFPRRPALGIVARMIRTRATCAAPTAFSGGPALRGNPRDILLLTLR